MSNVDKTIFIEKCVIFDKMTYWYFTCTGAAKINVIDISQVDNPRIVFHEYMGDFDPTDVEFCGDHVFVSLDNNQDREKGRLVVFKKYDTKANTMESVLNITGRIHLLGIFTGLIFYT